MATGMEMMFKSMLGVDPAEIKKKLEEGMGLLKNTLGYFDQRIKVLEQQNLEILTLLKGQDHGESKESIGKEYDNGNPDNGGGNSGGDGSAASTGKPTGNGSAKKLARTSGSTDGTA